MNSKSAHIGCQEISGTEEIRYIYKFNNIDLDLENNNLTFTQRTPAYDDVPFKFSYKKISSSAYMVKTVSSSADMVEIVIFDQMSPHSDPEFEDSKPIFLHDTLAHDVASSYQVWLQKVQKLRRYHPDENSLEF